VVLSAGARHPGRHANAWAGHGAPAPCRNTVVDGARHEIIDGDRYPIRVRFWQAFDRMAKGMSVVIGLPLRTGGHRMVSEHPSAMTVLQMLVIAGAFIAPALPRARSAWGLPPIALR